MKKVENLNEKSQKFMSELGKRFSNLPELKLDDLDKEKTVLVITDMINGFAKKGNLMDDRLKDLIPGIKKLMAKFVENDYEVLAFADYHDKNCIEFESFPKHCLKDSEESEVVDELKEVGGYKLIKKNSTNGLFAPDFQEWFKKNQDKDTYIIVGGCTDICVMQFSLAFKAYHNQIDKAIDIIVVKDLVDTFDVDLHDGDIHNLFSLYLMESSGIKIVKNIK